jgi:hypothetical protein
LPTNVHVFSAQGVGPADGSQVIVARALDDSNVVVSRSTATGVWDSWTAFGDRSFATPSITKSLGTWWTYTLAADCRVAIK